MPRIALVTCEEWPELCPDDRLVKKALEERGHEAAAVRWDDPAVAWASFDAVILRSTWDYHRRPEAFGAWLDSRRRDGTRLANEPALCQWNANKAYLWDLADAGVLIPPTIWAKAGAATLAEIVHATEWPELIVKPLVGASAEGVLRVAGFPTNEEEAEFASRLAKGDMLAQPFIPEIATRGEWSLVFLAGEYSHAVRKLPAADDFRVQYEYGGRAVPDTPPRSVRSAAVSILDALTDVRPEPWLYLRLDGVETDAGFMLMELELIEPLLFFEHSPRAAEEFAAAIEAFAFRVGSGR